MKIVRYLNVNNAMESNPQMVNIRLNQIDMQINTLNQDVKKLTTNQNGILNKNTDSRE